jgi:hypothetical protein
MVAAASTMTQFAVILVFAFLTSSAIGQDPGTLQSGANHFQAPDRFQVILETNVQNACPVVVNVTRNLAVNSADDFWSMVKHSPPIFFNSAIYKVVAGSYVQFGVSGDPNLNKLLGTSPQSYDSTALQNTYGTVAFITSPTQTIGLQLVVSLQDNHDFDRLNMAPFGHVSYCFSLVENSPRHFEHSRLCTQRNQNNY